MNSKILMISTGGTLASSHGGNGLSPRLDGSEILKKISGLTAGFEVDEEELFSLDSSNVQPEEWTQLARRIYFRRKAYDGIVVIHGTDTLAYTASALSFALPGIEIPVVLTGSQVPIENPIADATENCRAALYMAASRCPGVYVAFNRKIIVGTRASKVKTRSFDAFESINYPYAARIDSGGLVINPELADRSQRGCKLRDCFSRAVFLLKLFPGISPLVFRRMEEAGCQGVYVEGFGIGGVPFVRRDLTEAIGNAVRRGMVVAVGSQCLYEGSDFSVYETGRRVVEQGAVETGNMTSEAAITKLMWALGQYEDREQVKKVMVQNLAGELGVKVNWSD